MQTLDLQPLADKLAASMTVLLPLLTAFAGWAVAQLGKSRKEDKALTEMADAAGGVAAKV